MMTWIEISSQNLLHNLGEFRRIVGPRVTIMAVVKANAYGHGIGTVASALKDEKIWFAVDKAEEGILLRKIGTRQPILVMGYTPLDELETAARSGLDLTVYNRETITRLIQNKIPARVHLKLETGTTRQVVGEKDAIAITTLITKSPNVKLVGASTHYANIEDTVDRSYSDGQLKQFNTILQRMLPKLGFGKNTRNFSLLRHTAASAGAILFPETHFDAVRIGISLYGIWPSRETKVSAHESGRNHLNLKPVLAWKTLVAQVKSIRRGTPVSYGLTERVSRPSRVAVLPVGYYDGYDRGLSSVGSALIRGRRAKVLGRVCMNMIVVDVTDIPRVRLEDEAVLIGHQGREKLNADEVATKCGTIPYEILSRINPLLPRTVV